MNAETLTTVAVIAQHYDDSSVWNKDGFRFKHHDSISNGALQQFRHYNLVTKDDTWSTPTWEWTPEAKHAIEMCDVSPVTEASQRQLEAIIEHSERLVEMPLDDTFLVADFADSEYSLRGQALQTLSERGLIEKADASGEIAVWQLSTLLVRILNSWPESPYYYYDYDTYNSFDYDSNDEIQFHRRRLAEQHARQLE